MGKCTGTSQRDVSPRRSDAVLDRVLEDEVVLFDPRTNKIHSLNPTAYFIWEHCDGAHPPDQLATLLCRRYAVAPERASEDVRHLLDAMQTQGLIMW